MFDKALLIKIYNANNRRKNYFEFIKIYLKEIQVKDRRRTRKNRLK